MGDADCVAWHILLNLSSKNVANSSAVRPESGFVDLSPVRILSDLHNWRGLVRSDSTFSVQ